jgi:NADH:ubiquinone oxidoreductase subunit F (NADH-binding)
MVPRPELRLTHRALRAAGGTFGAGVFLVLDDSTCALGELARICDWLAAESAGQCGPCRFGLPALAADLTALTAGAAQRERVAHRHASLLAGRGACAHPDGASRFVTSAMAVLGREIELHRRQRGCGRPVLGQLPVSA